MKKVKTAILAAVAFGALSLGYAADAHASAYALTQDTITQLRFSAVRIPQGNLIGFNSFNFSGSTSTLLSTTGADFGFDTHAGTVFSQDRNIGAANVVDPKHANESDGPDVAGLGENNFTAFGTGGSNYSRSDHILSDTAVNNVGLAACVGAVCGGDFKSVTETFVKASQVGSPVGGAANATNSQTWGLSVNVPVGGANITIEFDLDLTQVVSLQNETGSAGATSNFNLSFQVGAKTVNFASLLNADAANPFASADETDVQASGSAGVNIAFNDANGVRHYIVTFQVAQGRASLLINYGVAASGVSVQPDPVNEVPEPMTLGLVGLGLVGLGAIARRRRLAA